IEQPLVRFWVRADARDGLAAPGRTRLTRPGTARMTQQPVRLWGRNAGALRDAERRHPQARLEAPGVDLVGQPGVAVREPVVRVPCSEGSLVAVIELDVAEEPSVEGRGDELQIGDHIPFGHGTAPRRPR